MDQYRKDIDQQKVAILITFTLIALTGFIIGRFSSEEEQKRGVNIPAADFIQLIEGGKQ
jgi:hypothetical protein